jgi:ligand-binding sensor domain-containing protein
MIARRLLLRCFRLSPTTVASLGCYLSCVLFLAGAVHAVDASKHATEAGTQRIIHESWTFKDGAPEAVEALAQTADGYLWLGSQSGLFRFDGIRFEPFRSQFGDQLMSTNVSALFAPATGGLWVGYRLGGFSFLKNSRVTNFPEMTASVFGFAQDRHGIVWAATWTKTGGLWRFDGSSWQNITAEWNAPPTPISQVGFDREGILWVLTEARGEPGKQLFFLLPDSRRFRKAGDNVVVESFTWDADRNVVTTRVPPAPGSGIQLESSLPAYPILTKDSAQILDRANGVWFVPRVEPGIWRHAAGEPLAEIVSKSSRNNSLAYDITPYRFGSLVDREGSVWMGDQKGIHRLSYSPLIELASPENVDAFALVPDEGGVVWVSAGNRNGVSTLFRVTDGKGELQKVQGGVANFAYRALDKTLWFGGEGGLWHIVNGSLTEIELPPALRGSAQYVQAITQDRFGGMWLSFGGRGLYRLSEGNWTPSGGRSDLANLIVISEFTDDLGRLWFGCTKSQLAMLDGDHVQIFGPNDGVRVGAITAIYGRASGIWVGGEFGLQHFDQGRFHTITAVDRESLRGISGIVETTNGDLWLNGLGGVFHIRRAEIDSTSCAYLQRTNQLCRRKP